MHHFSSRKDRTALLLAALACIATGSHAFAQASSHVPTPKYSNVVYAYDEGSNELRPLERERTQFKYQGGIPKARRFGVPNFANMKPELVIDGASCGFRVDGAKLQLVVAVPPTLDPTSNVSIVTLDANGSKRRVPISIETGIQHYDKSALVAYEGSTYNDAFTKIIPTHQLPAGEYAVSMQAGEFFCFGVGEAKR